MGGALESEKYNIHELDPETGVFSDEQTPVRVFRDPKMDVNSNVYKQLYVPENTYNGYAQLYQRLFGYAKVYYKDKKIKQDLSANDDSTSYYYQSKYGALKLDFEGTRVKDISTGKFFDL